MRGIRWNLVLLTALSVVTPLPAFAAGLITALTASANPVQVNTDVTFTVKGTGGGCGDLTIDYGDGQTIQLTSVSFSNNTNTTSPAHKYALAKTYLVNATPGKSCTGTAALNLVVAAPPGGGGGGFNRSPGYDALARDHSSVYLAMVTPRIDTVFPFSVIRPGGGVIVQGGSFGTQPGQFKLKLANGLVAELSQLEWAGNSIGGIIDPGISGVLDQPATLQVINSSGRVSNEVPVQFTARREVKLLPMGVISPDCSNGADNNQCIRCTSGCTFRAYHSCTGIFFSCNDSGTDSYSATLPNGWRFFSAQTRVEGSRADPPVLLRDEPGFLQIKIYWDTVGNRSAAYNGEVYVEGPVGTSW